MLHNKQSPPPIPAMAYNKPLLLMKPQVSCGGSA